MSDMHERDSASLATSEDELERRLDAMQRIASALVHEIRNVLNPIVSAAYLLEANANDPAKVKELAKRIEGFAKAEDRVAAKGRDLLEREAALGITAPTASPSSNK